MKKTPCILYKYQNFMLSQSCFNLDADMRIQPLGQTLKCSGLSCIGMNLVANCKNKNAKIEEIQK